MHSFRGFSKRYMRDSEFATFGISAILHACSCCREFLNLRRKTLNLIFKLNLIADFAAAENPNYG
jgi:hypothetical protein